MQTWGVVSGLVCHELDQLPFNKHDKMGNGVLNNQCCTSTMVWLHAFQLSASSTSRLYCNSKPEDSVLSCALLCQSV